MKSNKQSGNVLFLILIAVVLFAALSYAVTLSTRSGGSNASNEKAELTVDTILQYDVALRTGIERLKARGCNDNTLSFYNDKWDSSTSYNKYQNPVAPADGSCDVFGSSGAKVVWQKQPAGIDNHDYVISGVFSIAEPGGYTVPCAELILFAAVTKEMCVSINKKLGVTNPSGNPPNMPTGGSLFNGNATAGFASVNYGKPYLCGNVLAYNNSVPEMVGKNSGCFYNSDDSNYHFFDILIRPTN